MTGKDVTELRVDDLARFPVWEYEATRGETWVVPVTKLPVTDLGNRVVATQAQLADGSLCWLVISNVDLHADESGQIFQFLTFIEGDRRFHLARPFDPWYDTAGPRQLAEFLGRQIQDVFPLRFDLSKVAVGVPGALARVVDAAPKMDRSSVDIVGAAMQAAKRALEP